MKVKLVIISFSLLSFYLKSQNFNCIDFSQDLRGDLRTTINFVTEDNFNSLLKGSTITVQKTNKNIQLLQKEFDKKYNNKITKHCINAKIFFDDKIKNYQNCDETNKISLVDKVDNYFIFHYTDGFEINNYLLFNTINETIYFFKSLPVILDHGTTLITMKFNSAYSHGIDLYKFEDGNLKTFNIEFSRQYRPEKTYIIKDWANRTKILLNLVRYDLIEVSNTFKDGTRYDYNKEKFCRKFIVISN